MARRPTSCGKLAYRRVALAAICMLPLLAGCINVFTMAGRILMGDPKLPSAFSRQTGVRLEDGQLRVAVVCDAPFSILADFDSLTHDVQTAVVRRMKHKGIQVEDPNEVMRVLEGGGGAFSAARIASELDVNVVVHVQIEALSQTENGNPNLFRGQAKGLIRAFRVETESRQVVEVFQQEFSASHPHQHPVDMTSVPKRMLQRQFVSELAEVIGQRFYDVTTMEAR